MTRATPGVGPLGDRTPVLVGVGAVQGRGDAEATELMAQAAEAAADDAGSRALLVSVDRIAVTQGNWKYPDPGRLVGNRIGAPRAATHLVELGIAQQTLINEALTAIIDGTSEVALVAGGEAMLRNRLAERAGESAPETPQPGTEPDVLQRRSGGLIEPVEVATRLWNPVQQYAMIDNALRCAEGSSIDEQRAEISFLWERFNGIAQSNPLAAFPEPMTAAQLAEPSPTNRPLAFPYNKWHSSQWTVDQAAALLLCSIATARRLGISSDRWLFPLVGLESTFGTSLLRRRSMHRWPAMQLLGQATSDRIGRPVGASEIIEIYSCFPAAVRVQQRELGLPLDGTPTVTGGMAFAGGPFNNFVYQATTAVAQRLREAPEAIGVVTTVSGLLTKPGLAVWSGTPDGRDPLIADMAGQVSAATETVEVYETLEEFRGDATVATSTVTYEGMVPSQVVVVADTPDGQRSVAFSDDRDLAAHAQSVEMIGRTVSIRDGAFHLT